MRVSGVYNPKKICIILPYFGNWPKWINYFLLSCKYNPAIDWLFFADAEPPQFQAGNLKYFKMTLQKFNHLASKQTGMEITINHPYKLCDLKPAYGEIFNEYISAYDFWGYGDMDLVYGNINRFISGNDLSEYDIISNHNEFITGHFCLLRNNYKIRTLYKTGNQFIKAFQNKKYIGFDEQIIPFKINTDPQKNRLSKQIHLTWHLFIHNLLDNPFCKRLKKIKLVYEGEEIHSKQVNNSDFTGIVKNQTVSNLIKTKLKKNV